MSLCRATNAKADKWREYVRKETPTLRDDFAKAALTGLLASSTSMGYDACVAAAYRIADMMLEARK